MYSKYRSAFSFSHTILCMLKKMCVWYTKLLPRNEFSTMTRRRMYLDFGSERLLGYFNIEKSGIWNWSLAIVMWVYDVDWFIVRHWVRGLFFSLSVLSDFMALELFFLTSISRKSVQFRSHFIYCNLLFVLQSSSPRYYLSWMWHPPHSISDPLIDSFQFHFISFSRVDSNTTNMEFRTLKLAKQTHPVTQNITIFFFIFRNHNDHAMQKSIE